MNLLVTGGSGFIGSHVVELALTRPELRRLVNLDCLTYAGSPDNVRFAAGDARYVFERADLRDKAAVARVVRGHAITHVLHLAAESHVDRSIAGPDDFVHTNIVGTFHLLEACRDCWGGRDDTRLVQVSTDEVFGSLPGDGTFSETSPYQPNSPYSASKAAADLLARAHARTYGLPVITTHTTNNFGPRQHAEKLIPVVLRCLAERRPIPLYGDGTQVRDWIDVRDHAEGLWAALTNGRPGESYCLGARHEWTNRALVERLCDLVDSLAPERGGDSRRLIESVADRPGHDRRYALDPAKAGRELGWTARREFDASLRETAEWYLNRFLPPAGTPRG